MFSQIPIDILDHTKDKNAKEIYDPIRRKNSSSQVACLWYSNSLITMELDLWVLF